MQTVQIYILIHKIQNQEILNITLMVEWPIIFKGLVTRMILK
ncbi:hypothetical protein VC116063_003248 [Vibrio cholerae O1 str. 116063]|nr:hypothetical protein VC116063_003248 [Vibrio cholerae O1 str. 116063]